MGIGYVRQSAADIVDGLPITAAPINAEFNKLRDTFDLTNGHVHDGTSGNGPKISLTGAASVTGVLPVANGGTGGLLPVANGGTGGSTAAAGRTGLGLGTIATQNANGVAVTGGTISGVAMSNATITGGSVTGITDLIVADGGTGASTASAARTNLGLVIGTDVQPYSSVLTARAGITIGADQMVYGTDTNAYATTSLTPFGRSLIATANAAAARTTLALGTIATQNANGVAVTGGSITGITDIAIADGGTGASTASAALVNLGAQADIGLTAIPVASITGTTTSIDFTVPSNVTILSFEGIFNLSATASVNVRFSYDGGSSWVSSNYTAGGLTQTGSTLAGISESGPVSGIPISPSFLTTGVAVTKGLIYTGKGNDGSGAVSARVMTQTYTTDAGGLYQGRSGSSGKITNIRFLPSTGSFILGTTIRLQGF